MPEAPSGSLLSNFLFGGNKPKPPPLLPKRPQEPSYYRYNPRLGKWVPIEEPAAQLGQMAGAIPLNVLNDSIEGLKKELLGRGVFKRFGGEDQVISASYDYIVKAAQESGNTNLLADLNLGTFDKFEQQYRPWLRARQEADNSERIKRGELPIEGFGNYQVKVQRRFFFNPLRTAKAVSKEFAAAQAREFLSLANLGSDHPELSVFTKKEQADFLPQFIADQVKAKSGQTTTSLQGSNIAQSSRQALGGLQENLGVLLREYQLDQDKPEALRSSTLSQLNKAVSEKILSRGMIERSLGFLGKVYGVFVKFEKDPIGYIPTLIWDYLTSPIRRAWKKLKDRVKQAITTWLLTRLRGLAGLIFKAGKLLVNVGTKLLGNGFYQGSKLAYQGFSKVAAAALQAIGRIATRVISVATRAVTTVASRAVLALVAALAAISLPILAVIGAVVLVIVAITLVVIIVLIPFFQTLNPAAGAASPSDLGLVISASKTRAVSANEAITFTVTAQAFVPQVTTIVITATPDGNFSSVSPQSGGVAAGTVITWPAFNMVSGDTRALNFVATTSGAVTSDTEMLVRVSATSAEGYQPTAVVYLNRRGGSIGADGRHAFPVLGRNGWSCFHSFPNFNAIDIFADPGTPVVATISGRAEQQENSLGGPVVFLYGSDGYSYYYAHLEVGGRASGQVATGEVIGYISGDTVRSRNNGIPHVHFSIDTRGIHDGPDTPAGPFLDAVGGTNKCP